MKNSALSNASSAFQLQAFLNYKLIHTNDYFIAPGIDFGLQQVKINFKNNNSPGSFDSLFLTSGNYIRLTNLTPVAGVSIISHFKKIEQAKFKVFRLFANTRIGYKYGVKNNTWKADGNAAVNAPADRLNGYYVQMLFDFNPAK
jgi:hypothetical protein